MLMNLPRWFGADLPEMQEGGAPKRPPSSSLYEGGSWTQGDRYVPKRIPLSPLYEEGN